MKREISLILQQEENEAVGIICYFFSNFSISNVRGSLAA